MVAGAAISVSLELVKVRSLLVIFSSIDQTAQVHDPAKQDIRIAVNSLLQSSWSNNHERSARWILLQTLGALRIVGYVLFQKLWANF